jgi:xanthine/CO dehydrogenase XdhC/CoxF family maturation factor
MMRVSAIAVFALVLAASPIGAQVTAAIPDACAILTLSDVTTAMGTGYGRKASPFTAPTSAGVSTSCQYGKGDSSVVALFVTRVQGGDPDQAMTDRQARYQQSAHTVTRLPSLCDEAFIVVVDPKLTLLVAAKGPWQVDLQVMRDGTPDDQAAKSLATAACARLL